MIDHRPYQLDSSEAADSQRVDDVEVVQLQTGEEGILGLVPEVKNTAMPSLNAGKQSADRVAAAADHAVSWRCLRWWPS